MIAVDNKARIEEHINEQHCTIIVQKIVDERLSGLLKILGYKCFFGVACAKTYQRSRKLIMLYIMGYTRSSAFYICRELERSGGAVKTTA